MRVLLLTLALLCAAWPARAMTVRQAYDALAHRQTPFDPDRANMSLDDSAFLESLFDLTDRAMRDRVALQKGGKDGISIAEYNKRHAQIIKAMKALKASDGTAPVRKLIVGAIADQKDFLNVWAKAKPAQRAALARDYGKNPQARASHDKLLQAYMLLIRTYNMEGPQNRQSFYDSLTALDLLQG